LLSAVIKTALSEAVREFLYREERLDKLLRLLNLPTFEALFAMRLLAPGPGLAQYAIIAYFGENEAYAVSVGARLLLEMDAGGLLPRSHPPVPAGTISVNYRILDPEDPYDCAFLASYHPLATEISMVYYEKNLEPSV